ncbi:MAG: sugar phosphate isomerase/epimerase [Bryobacterales bacterium]|nr:sugar phosphate isomerase/epimerase [Bryobacterales bacterium]
MTRRQWIAAAALAGSPASRLVAQTYVWTQELRRRNVSLAAGIPEIFSATSRAGFRQVELMPAFFVPGVVETTLAHLSLNQMTAPIVYFGGLLHTREGIAKTLEHVHSLAAAVKPAGAVALNHNPDPKPGKAPKTAEELSIQEAGLKELDRLIRSQGLRFFVHHHDPEMLSEAREWRYILDHTSVELCLDADWVRRGGQDPVSIVRQAGKRTASLHIRSSRNGVWLESVGDSDIDYRGIADEFTSLGIQPFLVVELAQEKGMVETRSLEENLRRSREYVQRVFNVRA